MDAPAPPPLPMDALGRAARGRLSDPEANWLLRAVEIGRRGWGATRPNPMVGCVVVRDGAVVGEGWHRTFGGPHAEVEALEAAGDAARGATAFVSLEPCAHRGKTPPCTLALRNGGVARVVFGAADPTPEAGGGARALAGSGMEVTGPVFPAELAAPLDPAFFHRARSPGRPYLALKLALSMDGGLAAGPGVRTLLSGDEARIYTHRLRAGFDGVMVGRGTVAADDPLLTVREAPEPPRPPARLVLDSRARSLGPGSALLGDLTRVPVHLFCGPRAPEESVEALERQGVGVHRVPEGAGGLELDAVLRVCWEEGIRSVLCEGGGRLATCALREDRIRRMYLYLVPRVLGPEAVQAFPPPPPEPDGGWSVVATGALGSDALAVFDRHAPG